MNVVSTFVFSCLILMINAHIYDDRGTLIYEDLSCKPIKQRPSDPLPASYDCDEAFSKPCYYKGKNYNLNKPVEWQQSLTACSSSCRCKENGFLCADLRCPEIGLVTLTSPDCFHIYSINECCNVGQVCPPFENLPTCVVDGKTYMKGQKFFPNNTVLHCVCDENFNGKYEAPHCRKINCGIKLKYAEEIGKRCAPFYDDRAEKKCPSSWICPSDDMKDSVISVSNKLGNELACSYGDRKIPFQDFFERKSTNFLHPPKTMIRCTCSVPPLLTCAIMN
ncbi:hypothetical protein PPYR_06657 [Photinus pyralis]|uniref:VWFC domain-containing protein n=1 Tax=Photinus pyralis TaxID=7054 RepID=A0A5N4AN75_PHOPY|nr:uncharacterized protein LOC116168124 [Photinus pyralis]KAB0798777.1 hypothetical protein PPYR_06657 [Photinus pyralis]